MCFFLQGAIYQKKYFLQFPKNSSQNTDINPRKNLGDKKEIWSTVLTGYISNFQFNISFPFKFMYSEPQAAPTQTPQYSHVCVSVSLCPSVSHNSGQCERPGVCASLGEWNHYGAAQRLWDPNHDLYWHQQQSMLGEIDAPHKTGENQGGVGGAGGQNGSNPSYFTGFRVSQDGWHCFAVGLLFAGQQLPA